MDLILRLFFFLQDARWKNMWSLGAEKGEVTRVGWKETWQETESCKKVPFWSAWRFSIHQSKCLAHFKSFGTSGSAEWRGFPCVSMALRSVLACGGAVRWSPALPRDTTTCWPTGPGSEVGSVWFWTVEKESFFFFLNLDCCLHKLWSVLHGLCAFFSIYAIFFSFSSRNLSSWENMPEGGFRRKMIPWALFLHLNFWRENSSSRDS